VVPDAYKGPRIGDEGVTLDFVMAAVEEFRSQRLIHKKYVVQILLAVKRIFVDTASLMAVRHAARVARDCCCVATRCDCTCLLLASWRLAACAADHGAVGSRPCPWAADAAHCVRRYARTVL
jgi:hypothetical protein